MASNDKPFHRPNKRDRARTYILSNPTAGNVEVVKVTGVSTRTASSVRSELRAEGLISETVFGDWRTPKPRETGTSPEGVIVQGTSELLARAEQAQSVAGHEFSTEEQLALCRRLANDPREGSQVRLAALTVYNKIQSQLGNREELGPGKPLTDEDRIVRLSLLCQAVGFQTAVKAFERAFANRKEQDVDTADAQGAAQSLPEAAPEDRYDTGGGDPQPGTSEGNLGQEPDSESSDQG